jgi:hypothetical protein
MVWRLKVALVPVACLLAGACTTVATTTATEPAPTPYVRVPIIAVAADDIGVVAAVTPQSQGASLTVGYKGAKFAIMPVENRDGKLLVMDTPKGDQTYSIFTQLGLDAKGGTARGVAVQQVLAVGPAADAWVRRTDTVPQVLPPVIPVVP